MNIIVFSAIISFKLGGVLLPEKKLYFEKRIFTDLQKDLDFGKLTRVTSPENERIDRLQ